MSTTGLNTSATGRIADQTQLLKVIVDGLAKYNANPDPLVDALSFPIYRDNAKIPQAPLLSSARARERTRTWPSCSTAS